MKLGIQIVLWIASIFFTYKIYDSINGPIKFKQVKNERYAKVINRLKDIRTAQIAHRDVKGQFSNNFDSLIKFIDEGQFTLIEKRDSSYLEYDRTYRIDMLREVVVIDTLGTVPVKDSLFGLQLAIKICFLSLLMALKIKPLKLLQRLLIKMDIKFPYLK